MSSITPYEFTDINVKDAFQLRQFLFGFSSSRGVPIYSVNFNKDTKKLTVTTRESSYSTTTQNFLNDAIVDKYPDPQLDISSNMQTLADDTQVSQSVYGYFPQTTSIDGSATITKNTSLTRNMYYTDLKVDSGITLNANGWRIVVTGTLTLDGTIANDGTDASGIIAGVGTAPMYTTYLGTGTSGGAGLSGSGSGIPGVSALYQCSGGAGGNGGNGTGIYSGGLGGSVISISAVDGGLNTLSTMPVAFLGRLISNNFYIMGGTGGGGGGASKGNASAIRSGAGGGAGGLMIIAAKTIVGNGIFSAKGGNGSSASYSASGTQLPGGAGGGGGGGGGCVIIITQGSFPSTVSFNVSGGIGGQAVAPGQAGTNGTKGNNFIVHI